jgi:hypothetical protein
MLFNKEGEGTAGEVLYVEKRGRCRRGKWCYLIEGVEHAARYVVEEKQSKCKGRTVVDS